MGYPVERFDLYAGQSVNLTSIGCYPATSFPGCSYVILYADHEAE